MVPHVQAEVGIGIGIFRTDSECLTIDYKLRLRALVLELLTCKYFDSPSCWDICTQSI
jgi:hypothetical protein